MVSYLCSDVSAPQCYEQSCISSHLGVVMGARLKRVVVDAPRKALILTAAALWVLGMIGSRTLRRSVDVAPYQSTSASLRTSHLQSIKLQGEDYERTKNKTLVVYVYHESSKSYADNLDFFLKVGTKLMSLSLGVYAKLLSCMRQ